MSTASAACTRLQAAGERGWANVTWISPPSITSRNILTFSMLPSGFGLVGVGDTSDEQHYFYTRDDGRRACCAGCGPCYQRRADARGRWHQLLAARACARRVLQDLDLLLHHHPGPPKNPNGSARRRAGHTPQAPSEEPGSAAVRAAPPPARPPQCAPTAGKQCPTARAARRRMSPLVCLSCAPQVVCRQQQMGDGPGPPGGRRWPPRVHYCARS